MNLLFQVRIFSNRQQSIKGRLTRAYYIQIRDVLKKDQIRSTNNSRACMYEGL